MRRLLAPLLVMAAASAWAATSPDEMLADPVLEARARALGQELRCLVCQNQAIDDSDADLAQDLRHLVRERLVAGDSDAEIKAFLVARYGDFVLLEPPFRPSTWLLWLGPGLVVLGGGAALALYMRRQRPRTGETAPLSPAERAQLAKLLRDSGR